MLVIHSLTAVHLGGCVLKRNNFIVDDNERDMKKMGLMQLELNLCSILVCC